MVPGQVVMGIKNVGQPPRGARSCRTLRQA
jgi:hypothetical protein